MRMLARIILVTLMAAIAMQHAAAAEVRVLGTADVAEALRPLAAAFGRQTGHRVLLTLGSIEDATQKLAANEVHDAVILPEPMMDRLDGDGVVNPESRLRLAASSGITYEGALMSDGSEPEAARAFLEFLASAEARATWTAAKLEPVAER
ncbi:MAG: substrate-binding domain-containing protein [Xanthobacteraceae bacterium]